MLPIESFIDQVKKIIIYTLAKFLKLESSSFNKMLLFFVKTHILTNINPYTSKHTYSRTFMRARTHLYSSIHTRIHTHAHNTLTDAYTYITNTYT